MLTHNGLCAAFTCHGQRLGLLNVEHDEVCSDLNDACLWISRRVLVCVRVFNSVFQVVRSLFYNKTNRSIISVSVFNRDK